MAWIKHILMIKIALVIQFTNKCANQCNIENVFKYLQQQITLQKDLNVSITKYELYKNVKCVINIHKK